MTVRLNKIYFLVLLLSLIAFNIGSLKADDERLYEILEAADHRDASASIFNRVLAGGKLSHQRQALLALGRIGNPSRTLEISSFLYSPQPDLRIMAAFALGINNDPKAHSVLVTAAKKEKNNQVLEEILRAIGKLADAEGSISSLLPFLDHKDNRVIASACDGLTLAWTFHRDSVSIPNSTQIYKLIKLSTKNDEVAKHCLYTISRLRAEPELFDQQQLFTALPSFTSTTTKMLSMRIIAAIVNKDLASRALFETSIIDASNNKSPLEIRIEAAGAIATLSSDPKSLDQIIDSDPNYLKIIQRLAHDPSSHVRVMLINNLTLKNNPPLIKIALEMLEDESQWVKNQTALALFPYRTTLLSERFLKAVHSDQFIEQQFALDILRAYKVEAQDEHLKILSHSKHKGIKSIATRLINDEDPDSEQFSPANVSAPAKQTLSVAGKKLAIKTDRGTITIQLMSSAAYTSAAFYQLATSGFYDGLMFHRVVPNFVDQGGDPERTGQGGPGFSIREELYPMTHERGTVGIATSGKDTGGSQFFFNISDNLHLNSNYTIFARITDGIELISKIEVGDTILSIKEI